MDLDTMDLADAAVFFLAGNHGGQMDPNARAMYDNLRTLVEQNVYSGGGMGGDLNRIGLPPDDKRSRELAGRIRRAMRNDPDFVDRAWFILQHNRLISRKMPDGPRLADAE